MKKIVLILCTILTVLTGCTHTPTSAVELPKSFVSDVEITVKDTSYCATLSRYSDGCWQVEMTSPAAVKGLIFTITGGETDVSFDGLRFTFDTQRFPVGSVVQMTLSRLDRLFSSPVDVINGDEQCLATGSLGEESYTLTLSKTHIPQKLEFADSEMSISFNSFDLIEKEDS